MKSALVIASVSSMIGKFNMNNIEILISLGYQVTVATNFKTDAHSSKKSIDDLVEKLTNLKIGLVQIDFSRSGSNIKGHFESYKQVFKLLDKNFDIIHTHTPIASAIVRLANRFNKNSSSKVIYTAHGFHFYKGAPAINWITYYPIERILSKYTDLLITINREDFKRSKSFNAKDVEYIPGVGVEVNVLTAGKNEIKEKKQEFNITSSNILISVGELNNNKNHYIVIEALSKIKDKDFEYLIVGEGPNKKKLQDQINNHGLQNKIKLCGYRNDIQELLQLSDIFVFPSFREGLSKSVMEAMASGLVIVASSIRGNTDLIDEGRGGFLFNPKSSSDLSNCLLKILNKPDIKNEFGIYNNEKIKQFSTNKIDSKMRQIYINITE